VNQEHFDRRTRLTPAQQPSVPYPRGIQDQQVAGSDERRQLGKARVDDGRCPNRNSLSQEADPPWQYTGSWHAPPVSGALSAVIPQENQELASGPVGQRLLGNELWREVVIEIRGAEGLRRQRSLPVDRVA
jgi:hypothetical protein